MDLQSSVRSVTGADVLFALYLTVALPALVVLTYDFAEALLAPTCASPNDLGLFAWCMPIGFEGPFGDFWANRSFFNARVAATFNLLVVASALACAAYFVIKRHERSRAVAYYCGLAVMTILIVKAVILNDPS